MNVFHIDWNNDGISLKRLFHHVRYEFAIYTVRIAMTPVCLLKPFDLPIWKYTVLTAAFLHKFEMHIGLHIRSCLPWKFPYHVNIHFPHTLLDQFLKMLCLFFSIQRVSSVKTLRRPPRVFNSLASDFAVILWSEEYVNGKILLYDISSDNCSMSRFWYLKSEQLLSKLMRDTNSL